MSAIGILVARNALTNTAPNMPCKKSPLQKDVLFQPYLFVQIINFILIGRVISINFLRESPLFLFELGILQ